MDEQVVNASQTVLSPRRRNAALTRHSILIAAQDCFGAVGYTAAGVRKIAAAAGADPALIRRYFGTKQDLFRAALDASFDMGLVLAGPREAFVQRTYDIFSVPGDPPVSLAIMMRSLNDATARPICQQLFTLRVVEPLAQWIGADARKDTAARLMTLWVGYFMMREMGMAQATIQEIEGLARWVADTSEAIIDLPRNRDPARVSTRS